ncbi:hypothetical protein V6667_08505 [Neisseria leonii]|uniref:Branched-chain amino acid ABC transporter n=1 Tax=Neisseria leonii TaxID=2995413 RepID=A0A9X4IB36_9NEIS|nr:hypothetical protein [Neisseria sp. 51.81]MDD9327999.1 hypothetical protein [Neisseria sp. 51.81]
MTDFAFLLLFSAATIFIFRIFPFFFKNNSYLNNQDGFLYKSISYSAQAMIGMIVFNSAFSGRDVWQLSDGADLKDAVKIVLLIMTFWITVKTKKIIPGFLLFLSLYAFFIYLFH